MQMDYNGKANMWVCREWQRESDGWWNQKPAQPPLILRFFARIRLGGGLRIIIARETRDLRNPNAK